MNRKTLKILIRDKRYFIIQLKSYLLLRQTCKTINLTCFDKLHLPIVETFTKRKIERIIKKSEKWILKLELKNYSILTLKRQSSLLKV